MMQLEEVRADLMVRHCSMQSDQHRPGLLEHEVIEHQVLKHEVIEHQVLKHEVIEHQVLKHEVIEHDAPLSDRQSNLAKGQRGARNEFQHSECSSATAATASSDPSQHTKDDRTLPSCHQTCADKELEATGRQFLTRDR
jgi:hypothetical protein